MAEAAEVNEVGEFSKAWKITNESSRILNSIILGLVTKGGLIDICPNYS